MLKDLFSELKAYMKGSTFDAILPGLVFILSQGYTDLLIGVLISLSLSLVLLVIRLKKGAKWYYSVVGFLGVVVAGVFAYMGKNSNSFFLPQIIGSGSLLFLCFISIIIKKPFAAWMSHLTRGWNKKWFWRQDIMPAYMEVTLVWSLFLLFRLIILIRLYAQADLETLFLYNFILGLPMTLIVLSASYIYGVWRLNRLGGPGIDEYENKSSKPWLGQKKGF